MERAWKRVLTFAGADPAGVAAALAAVPSPAGTRRVVSTVDGRPAGETPPGTALVEAGFVASYKGLARRR